jgi:hypothetical protein
MPRGVRIVLVLGAALAACSAAPLDVGGCRDAMDCEIAEFCKHPEGKCDAVGECMVRPEMCNRMYLPVCGCDGATYSNSCVAWAAGASIAHPGACEEPTP